MKNFFVDVFIISWREVIRGLREKSRLYGSLTRPVIWLFLLGNGLRPSLGKITGQDYLHFIFPGIIVMNVLFAGIMSGTSIIWDREFGFLKEILVAPVSRTSIALGKTLGGALNATIQGVIVLFFFPIIQFKIGIISLLLGLAAMFFTAFAITSLGVLIAVRMKSFEGFGIMNNFVVMPLFFLSGALYPVEKVSLWIKYLIYLNPVYYSVGLVRSILLQQPMSGSIWLDLLFLTVFTGVLLAMVIFLFNRE